MATPVEDMIPASQEDRMALLSRLEQVPLRIRVKEDQEPILNSFSHEELEELYLDLRPFMQKHPFLIHSNARFADVFLFQIFCFFLLVEALAMGLKFNT